MKYIAQIDNRQHEVEVELEDGLYSVTLDGKRYEVDSRKLPWSSVYSMLIAGKSYEANVRTDGDVVSVCIQGEMYKISLREELWARISAAAAVGPRADTHELKAPMPGLVVEVRVKPGQKVNKGQPLVVVEAMKMQNEVCAPEAGTVKTVCVKEQAVVTPAQVLVVLESAP
ncbi:MAG: biotin/lipoyl-binding protein [Candidatus Eisenbacteria bacterium]|nr:biotin/lipoyl-binding protein [Candidatus Eisenbacteria bacterium]